MFLAYKKEILIESHFSLLKSLLAKQKKMLICYCYGPTSCKHLAVVLRTKQSLKSFKYLFILAAWIVCNGP